MKIAKVEHACVRPEKDGRGLVLDPVASEAGTLDREVRRLEVGESVSYQRLRRHQASIKDPLRER